MPGHTIIPRLIKAVNTGKNGAPGVAEAARSAGPRDADSAHFRAALLAQPALATRHSPIARALTPRLAASFCFLLCRMGASVVERSYSSLEAEGDPKMHPLTRGANPKVSC